ncbi:MAG: 2-C-methyl-D-erythritol 2,4-cyclodiphosphate synthase [Desulfobacterales bacterium]|jgi:2-C-methyl-D-erythritol 2,4-cyclodiphosphate synthase|nr:2-C-methyl-D-erythritol 2,4-cyclodiphosphate synthase [Desulfobacteraceae bacterium]MBT4365349.1 2-C-methyl-D-erythritol 2,4-cyclodiphosphate synthase [Desulfobacteraceae bacterium]MBT7084743.1 2-C-methyl-D-erythritol 2,4-cyclodiphosphate synthase [Desulfobacterales bacterium]MBT7696057.1 2-C-methyl-D-erythritol 2,4-cyclodiphosphate synthase [Desulfobacterales bacterium]
MRIGTGYDVHRLVPDRKLILGGVTIPNKLGLLGHSDADVLVHSLCDALLGAAGMGDIGIHFSDSDPEYKDIDSMKILSSVLEMVSEKGFIIINIDSTICAESPKIAPYRDDIQKNIAKILKIDFDRVNIKATTTEGLGFIGRGEGIGAMSTVLLNLI